MDPILDVIPLLVIPNEQVFLPTVRALDNVLVFVNFCLGPVSKAYEAIDRHAQKRLRQWLCTKHKVQWPGAKRFPAASLYEVFGLVCLPKRTGSLPRATS